MITKASVLSVLLSLLTLCVAPWLGETLIPVFDRNVEDSLILTEIRIPRVLLAFTCGAVLALGGLVFQAMFRNPLATPYTLGAAGGASFAVALWVNLGLQCSFWIISGVSLAALVGAGLSVLGVYQLARLLGSLASVSLLLAGVVLSFLFASMTMLVQFFADAGSVFRMLRWTMGSMSYADYDALFSILPMVVIGMGIVFRYRYELDLLSVGDELAMSRGLDVDRIRKHLFLAVSLMLAAVISVCGPIGFVGIVVPHLVRLLCGADHRLNTWVAAFLGGAFLVSCDILARSVTVGSDLPVGIITALIGGPFFLFILLGKNRMKP
ncbi:FecCD family ABC transporter permease [Rubritalea marina]|uniref:FecCD family ABC transporter permease n=1 Tax=Rubritalea marina TaxID=361055 RepID=UPI00036DE8ED|nr:iron ABC transporter permease [Rubritalea marina]